MSRSTADIEADLRDLLTRCRKAWRRPDAHVEPARTSRQHGPRSLLRHSWVVRQSVTQDVAFWLHAALDADLVDLGEQRIDATDVEAMCSAMLPAARAISGWEHAETMAAELDDAVRALERLTRDRRPAVQLGECTVELVGADGERRPCGGEVRADVDRASDVRCPRCHTVDTIEGWQRRIVGQVGPVTADRLVVILRGVGIRTTSAGIRQRVIRGSIPKPIDVDERGRNLYDATAVLRALMAREHRLTAS